jgi:hypothetical protein
MRSTIVPGRTAEELLGLHEDGQELDPLGADQIALITSMRLIDRPTKLEGVPTAKFFAWFVGFSLGIPAVVAIVVFSYLFMQRPAGLELGMLMYGVVCLVGAVPTGAFLLSIIPKQETKLGTFFILDKTTGKLSLPRLGIDLDRSMVQGLEILRGRIRLEIRNGGWTRSGFVELRVIVGADEHSLQRYPIAMIATLRPIRKAATLLSEFYGVPVRLIKRRGEFITHRNF